MPEGDTVHRWAGRLRAAIGGRPLRRFELRRDPRGVRFPAVGTIVEHVEAQGKHLLIRFGDGATLHTHMRMQGTWHVYQPGERWRRAGHRARVVLEVEGGTQAVCFDAPVVELRRDAAAVAHLGPDLAADEFDLDGALARLATLPPHTQIGDALLDQRVVAGIGNVYKSEICWACRVHPRTPLSGLADDARRALFVTARQQLRANIGSSRRVTYAGGFAVYGRSGRTCPRCRSTIRRDHDGDDERVTYWCPSCQPEP